MKVFRLSNGIDVIYEENQRDVVSCSIFLPLGSSYDVKDGITFLSLRVGFKPSKKDSSLMERYGSPIVVDTSNDYSVVMFQTLNNSFLSYVNVIDKLLKREHFNEHEFYVEKQGLLSKLRSKIENPFTMCYEELIGLTYSGTPYEKLPYGRVKSISSLAVGDVESWFKGKVLPKRSVISISGRIAPMDLDGALKLIEGFKTKELPEFTLNKVNPKTKRIVLKRPQSTQAFIMIALPAPSLNDQNFVPFKISNVILGGGTSSILFQMLREKKGYAYSVGSFYPSRKFESRLFMFIGTSLEKQAEAEDEMMKIKLNLGNFIGASSLKRAKNYIKGTYIMEYDTNLKKSWYKGFWQLMKTDYNFNKKYLELVDEVRLDDIAKLSRKLSSDAFQKVVVTDG